MQGSKFSKTRKYPGNSKAEFLYQKLPLGLECQNSIMKMGESLTPSAER